MTWPGGSRVEWRILPTLPLDALQGASLLPRYSGGTGRDLSLRSTGELLQGDLVGVAGAGSRVERIDRRELVGGEREVEDVEVLGDPLGSDGLRDRRAALLHMPAQHDLRSGLAVCLGDATDHGIAEGALPAPAVEGDAADRRPRLGEDAEGGVEVLGGTLRDVGVQLGRWSSRPVNPRSVPNPEP